LAEINVYQIIISFFCLVFAFSVHEAAHALVADWRGDSTPRLLGRVTLNPIPHLDPFGSIILPLIMMFMSPGFMLGWAKPVTFIPRNLRNPAKDSVLIALAGPGANLLLAVTAAIALRIVALVVGSETVHAGMPLVDVLDQLVAINIILLIFNMIPLPPLDGHAVLSYFLPSGAQRVLASLGPFGLLLALVLISRTPHLVDSIRSFIYTVQEVAKYGSLDNIL